MYVQLCYNTCILYILVCGIMFKIEYVNKWIVALSYGKLKNNIH